MAVDEHSSATEPATEPATIIDVDTQCIHCGYNLRTLARDGRCPECGRLVSDSLRPHPLHHCRAGWLRGMIIGMIFLLAAPAGLFSGLVVMGEGYALFVVPLLAPPASAFLWQPAVFTEELMPLVCFLAAALHLTGVILITRVDRAANQPLASRLLLRAVTVGAAFASGVVMLTGASISEDDMAGLSAALAAGDGLCIVVFHLYLYRLALRWDKRRLMWRCAVSGLASLVGAAALVVLLSLIPLIDPSHILILSAILVFAAATVLQILTIITFIATAASALRLRLGDE